jgi:hypothetical protein
LVPADRITVAMMLKELEGLSDRQAVPALETDIRWKAAAGMALDEKRSTSRCSCIGVNG